MELAPDFDEFFGSLSVHDVEFLVVGAYALAFRGAPRFTGDIDVLNRPTTAMAAGAAALRCPRGDAGRCRIDVGVVPRSPAWIGGSTRSEHPSR